MLREIIINKLKNIVTKHDGPVWDDNDLEFFINDPIMGSAYYQIVINSLGTVCDGLANPRFSRSLDTGTVAKISKGKDRYFMEVKIPVKNITGSKLTAGSVLKMNVMRGRRLAGDKMEKEKKIKKKRSDEVNRFHQIKWHKFISV